jgi:arylsulfatase A-like enzyme
MAALFTSRHPTELGLVEADLPNAGEFEWRQKRRQLGRSLPASVPTLAERLQRAGFQTAAFVNQPLLALPDAGFRRGFDAWYSAADSGEITRDDPQLEPLPQSRDLRAAHVGDAALVEAFGRWAQGRQAGPVFVWLHLLTPHRPYASWPSAEPLPAGPQVRADVAYDAEVRLVDAIVGRAVDLVDARFGVERSAIVFTSDHGEEFGEHGMYEHGHSLHREVVEVPLILVAPGYAAGTRVAANVRSVDLLPTLLELVGRPDLTPAAARGESLTRALEETRDRDAYVEGVWYGSTERSFQAEGYKLMYDAQGERWRLFDVAADPGEERDLAQREPERAAKLRARLLQRHSEARAVWMSTETLPARAAAPLDGATQRALEALGYLESDPD